MIYLLDTSVLVNLVFADIIALTEEEKESVRFANSLEPRERWVADFVLTEFALVAQKVLPSKFLLTKDPVVLNTYLSRELEFFDEFSTIFTSYVPDHLEVEVALKDYVEYWKKNKSNRALSFVDLFLLSLAKKHGVGLLTVDRKMSTYIKPN